MDEPRNTRNFQENSLFLTGRPLEVDPDRPHDQTRSIKAMYHKSVTKVYRVLIGGVERPVKVRFLFRWFYWSAYLDSPYFWNTSARGREIQERNRFVYYLVYTEDSNDPIGSVTSYVTEERITSLLYRYYNKTPFEPVSFTGSVRANGVSRIHDSGTDYKSDKQIYVHIPEKTVSALDLHVDDLLDVSVTNKDGYTVVRRYHISMSNKTAIIPLSKFRRLGITTDPLTDNPTIRAIPKGSKINPDQYTYEGGIVSQSNGNPLQMVYKIPKKTAMEHGKPSECIQEYTRFIEVGDTVTVTISPVSDATRYFFHVGTLSKILSVRDTDRRTVSRLLEDTEDEDEQARIRSRMINTATPTEDDLKVPESETVQGWIQTEDEDTEDD